jgi:Putative stress-responsive transcriptional regulator
MNREEFIKRLGYLLQDIPRNESVEAIQYYQNYFEEAGIENEKQVIMELESPEKVAILIRAGLGDAGASNDEFREYTENGYEDIRFSKRKHVPEKIVKESRQQERNNGKGEKEMGEKRLYKSRTDRRICGVCGGVAEYLNIDSTIIRLVVALLAITGTSILFYIAAAIIMPERY